MQVRLDGRNAIITGGSAGIGKAIAKSFLTSGANVAIVARRSEVLMAAKAEIEAEGKVMGTSGRVIALSADIRNSEECEKVIAKTKAAFGRIDVLVNNAGGAHGHEPLAEGDVKDWDEMIDSNVKGLLYMSRLVVPGMRERNRGQVVNVSSIAGKETYANGVVYCAAKAAVEAISKGMRLELNPFGIRVTNIAPGAVETNFSTVRFKGDTDKADAVYRGYQPLSANDIADVIAQSVWAPSHVQLADVLIFPKAQASAKQIYRKETD